MKKDPKDRIKFYLSFFDKKEHYEEKNVNGFWLVKQSISAFAIESHSNQYTN